MSTGTINNFPVPHTDEIFFSVVARYHLLSGNRSTDITLRQLFNTRSMITITGLPSHIGHFFDQLPVGWTTSNEEFVDKLTLFSYYRPFLSPKQVADATKLILSQNGSGIKGVMGLIASRVGAAEIPRYCMECATNDLREFGTPYWHRSHLLPGVLTCFEHNVLLREFQFPPNFPSRHKLILPTKHNRLLSITNPPKFTPAQLKILSCISINSKTLLDSCTIPIPREQLLATYKDRLDEMGFLTSHGSVRQSAFQDHVLTMFADIAAIPPFAKLLNISSSEHSWIASLLRHQRKSTHPLKHLLIILAMFDSVPIFLDRVQQSPRTSAEAAITEPCCQNAMIEQLERLLLVDQVSLTQAASLLGVSVTTLSVAAAKNNIPLLRKRPKQLSSNIESAARRLLKKGKALIEIVRICNLSISHLNRMLRANPQLCYQRKRSLYRSERRRRRLFIKEVLASNPNSSRTDIRKIAPGAWIWLYRHDRDWLQTELPEGQLNIQLLRNKADWEHRDKRAAEEIRAYATVLIMQQGEPIRLTKATLIRATGFHAALEKHGDLFPETRKCLEELSELIEDFQIRRVAYVTQRLIREGVSISPWRIKKEAGLPKVMSTKVEKAVFEHSRYRP